MGLTTKELAAYLPYGISVIFDEKIIGILSGITPNLLTELIVLEEMDNNTPAYKNWCIDDTKLILRPLSDLVKKIEVNGERFVPALRTQLHFKNQAFPLTYQNRILLENRIITNTISYCDMQYLISLHFDVFGLIERGSAVDINTLKQFKKN